jgi:hypothetical protein
MQRDDGTPVKAAAREVEGTAGYEPPRVAWEEEFAPLAADSLCNSGLCSDGRPSPGSAE